MSRTWLQCTGVMLLCGCGTPMAERDANVMDARDDTMADVAREDSARDDAPMDAAREDAGQDDVTIDTGMDVPIQEVGMDAGSPLDAMGDVGTPDASVGIRLGISAIAQRVYALNPPTGTLTTTPKTTQMTGSMMVASIARGTWSAAPNAPTDNKNNTYVLQGTTHAYGAWPTSQTGLYQAFPLVGGTNHTFSMTWGNIGSAGDEVTISAVEVLGAQRISDVAWVERAAANSLTSATVRTNGPALLLAWWWGSGGVRPVGQSHVATPGSGFTLVPGASGTTSLSANGYIQVAVAYRSVMSAGTYSVTWTTDNEGAQLYLVALE